MPHPGDLNNAEGLKDLGLFSGVPEAAGGGKLATSALGNVSIPSAASRVRSIKLVCQLCDATR